MKRMLTVSLLLLAFVMASSLVMAETEVEVTGQVRARTEMSDRTFHVDDKLQDVTYLRTRVTIEAKKDDNATAFVQFQDSRMLGSSTMFGADASGGLNDGKNVDIHQAYIKIDKIWWDGFGGQVGRFEINMGNQRVFGAVGWHNVGRTWEGGMHWYGTDSFKLTGFVVKRVERNAMDGNADFDVYGLNYHNNKLGMDLFVIYDYDAENVAVDIARLKRISFGTYYHRVHNTMDYTLNAVMQTGTQGAAEQDISAYLITFEAGYSMDNDKNTRLAIGIDLASGTEAGEADDKTYKNLYYTGHKFRGHMDYFLADNTAGLMDIYLRGRTDIKPGWTLAADVHMFSTAQDYTYAGELTSDLGTEIDLSVKTNSVAGVGMAWGLSYFIAKDAMAGMTDSDPGLWVYGQTTINF